MDRGLVAGNARCLREIAAWSEKEFIGVHVTLEIQAVEQPADETTVTADVGGEGYNGPSRFAFQVADERVTRMTISG